MRVCMVLECGWIFLEGGWDNDGVYWSCEGDDDG